MSSSDLSPTDLNNVNSSTERIRARNKSKSISNGVLQHHRELGKSLGAAVGGGGFKKVSFSHFKKFGGSSSVVDLTSSSITSSEDDQYYDDSDDDDDDDADSKNSRLQQIYLNPPKAIAPSAHQSRKNILKRLSSYPMEFTKSLDSQVLGSSDSNSNLPEFNKRPLTDTPIVSSVASPITRTQSYEYDDDKTEDEYKNKVVGDSTIVEESSEEGAQAPIAKTKNISHLNLLDLQSRSVSPNTVVETKKEPEKEQNQAELDVTQMTVPQIVEQVAQLRPEISPNTPLPVSESPVPAKPSSTTGESLSKKGKEELEKAFEKTPSLEKLKSLLLTKPPPPARKANTLNIPGQTSSKTSPDGRIASVDVGSKLVIVMVGLPARGKSYITNKLTRYLNWLQHDCRVFNVGNTRRKDKNNAGPEANPLPDIHTPNNEQSTSPQMTTTSASSSAAEPKSPVHNADFFSPDNNASNILREKWAIDTLDQLLNYVIDGPGSVGIFDATNSTKKRRLRVLKRIQERSNGELKVLFLESVCSDPAIIESNIRLKLSGPDYREMEPEAALKDFVGRLHNYERAYETIDEQEESIPGFQYVKMINVGKKVVSYNVQGFLASQTIYFLLNFNLCERQIWITRHGELTDNLTGRIGGDSHLTKRGEKFARALLKFMNFQRQEFRKQQLERFSTRLELKYESIMNSGKEVDDSAVDNIPSEPNFCVWTSMLCRAIETGKYFDDQLYSVKEMRMLNELGGGKFEGLTYEEIQLKYPKEFQARIRNKLTYRYPGVGGESYLDVLTRLRPLITEVERTTDNLLIVSHRVVLRVLLAYFLNLDNSSIGELDVPLHTLYCLELKPYGTDYRMYEFDEGLDWFVKVEPEHQKNMKEVGVAFRERKYSVVPTAPPSSSVNKARESIRNRTYSSTVSNADNGVFSIRRSLSFGAGGNSNFVQSHNSNPRAAGAGVQHQLQVFSQQNDQDSITSKKLADLKKMRKP